MTTTWSREEPGQARGALRDLRHARGPLRRAVPRPAVDVRHHLNPSPLGDPGDGHRPPAHPARRLQRPADLEPPEPGRHRHPGSARHLGLGVSTHRHHDADRGRPGPAVLQRLRRRALLHAAMVSQGICTKAAGAGQGGSGDLAQRPLRLAPGGSGPAGERSPPAPWPPAGDRLTVNVDPGAGELRVEVLDRRRCSRSRLHPGEASPVTADTLGATVRWGSRDTLPDIPAPAARSGCGSSSPAATCTRTRSTSPRSDRSQRGRGCRCCPGQERPARPGPQRGELGRQVAAQRRHQAPNRVPALDVTTYLCTFLLCRCGDAVGRPRWEDDA